MVGDSQALSLDGLQILINLVERSLICKIRSPIGEPRFTFLESIREYLMDRLHTSEGLDATHRQYARYYLEIAERTYSEMKGGNQRSRLPGRNNRAS